MTVFHEEMDALGLAEDHALRVLELEESAAKRLLRVYGRVAAALRARLQRLPPDSFTAQQMRVTLLQLEATLLTFEQELAEQASIGAGLMADQGVADLATEINVFNDHFRGSLQMANVDLAVAATDAKNYLINNYRVSIETYSQSLRNTIARNLQNLVIERVPAEEIHRRMVEQDGLARFFLGEEWRLRRIVRTELHNMYGTAKLNGLEKVEEHDDAVRKTLYHPRDHRTGDDSAYLATLNLRPKVNEPFEYVWQPLDKDGNKTGKSYKRKFMAPPDRPNDRAILIPWHPSWRRRPK